MLPAKRCGWPRVGGLDFSAQNWRALHIGHCFLHLCHPYIMAGELWILWQEKILSSRGMGVPVEVDSNSPHHVASLIYLGQLKRGPYLPGQLPVVIHFWNLCQLLPPVRQYWVPVPTRLLISHIPLLGVLRRNHFCFLPLHCWLAPGECSGQHLVPTLVAAPGQIPEKCSSAPSSSQVPGTH